MFIKNISEKNRKQGFAKLVFENVLNKLYNKIQGKDIDERR